MRRGESETIKEIYNYSCYSPGTHNRRRSAYAITPSARVDHQLNLGNKYLQEGKYQEAILAFQKVIQIEPKNIPARLGLGHVYVATSDFAKAETVLKEVIVIDQKNILARVDLFNVYLKEGNLDKADIILKEITTLDPIKDTTRRNVSRWSPFRAGSRRFQVPLFYPKNRQSKVLGER